MKISLTKVIDSKILKKELKKYIKHIIKAHPGLQYIKVNLTITYLKGSELINDEPLCTEYLLNIKSTYKKDENYFISKMLKSIENLKKMMR